jgi:hypothetical protein
MPGLFDPIAPPPAQPCPTSRAAATAIVPIAAKQRQAVLDALRASWDGLTDEQIGEAVGIGGSSSRPRRIELVKAGLVIDSGRTRPTRAGRQAVIWEAVGNG